MRRTAFVAVAVATVWTAPSSPRQVDRPALTNPVDLPRWLADMSVADKRGLTTDNLTQTQVLYGHRVDILDEQEGWVEVAVPGQPTPKNPLGYPGWVPRAQLARSQAFAASTTSRPVALVNKAATTWLYNDPGLTRPTMEVSVNTRLPVLTRTGRAVLVATPDRGRKWLPSRDVGVYRSENDIPYPTGATLVACATMLLGRPYLWAGRSGFAVDCSGLTSTIYQVNGITIPRDADAQALHGHGRKVSRDDLHPGDLLFYTADHGTGSIHHVAMSVGGGRMAEAHGAANPVWITPARFGTNYWGARRYLRG